MKRLIVEDDKGVSHSFEIIRTSHGVFKAVADISKNNTAVSFKLKLETGNCAIIDKHKLPQWIINSEQKFNDFISINFEF